MEKDQVEKRYYIQSIRLLRESMRGFRDCHGLGYTAGAREVLVAHVTLYFFTLSLLLHTQPLVSHGCD